MPRSAIFALRLATASVWFVFGIGFKLLDLVPRHRAIVATFVGESAARPVTAGIGIAETLLGVWILTGIRPRLCAAVQTAAIVTMNALELACAHELLMAPIAMVCANAVFLVVVWFVALADADRAEVA